MKYFLFFLIIPFLLISTGCQVNNAQTTANALGLHTDSIPSKRQLRRSFWEKRELLIVYGAEDQSLKERYKKLLDRISKTAGNSRRGNLKVEYIEASQVEETDLEEKVLFLVGSPEENKFIGQFSRDLPVTFTKGEIHFNNKVFRDELFSLLFFPNPNNHTLPFSLLSGNDAEEVFTFFQEKADEGRIFSWQNMDYELYRKGKRLLMGNFNSEWFIDEETYFDYTSGNDTIFSSKHFDFISHQDAISPEEAKQLASDVENTTSRILSFTTSEKELPRFTYHIYKTAEDKGLMVDNTYQAHLENTDNSIHTIINKKYEGNYIERENALLLQHLLDSTRTNSLQRGLAVYFTDNWQREGYLYWAARLAESGNTLSLKELTDNELMQWESPLISDCMTAVMVAFLIDKWGKEQFLEKYNNWVPTAKEVRDLEPEWKDYLSALSLKFKKKERIKPELPYLKGFNFAHEGYSIYNGYLSRKATQAIEKQKSMGSNSIAIVPYSFMRSDSIPDYIPINNWAGSENDAGVVHSAFEARELGMTSMLKPQIFFGRSWPGALEMKSEEDWNLFFDNYYRWIRHYAFLAEIHQIDMFCAGVEFSIATLNREDDWRKIFRKIRGLYQGQLTYASNWGEEFEKVGFWDELDFIGLNSYYPLSKNDNPTDEELRENFEKVKNKIKKVHSKFGKPVVFTEIGFRSMDMPWKNPHEDGDDSFNEEHQRRCYEIIFEGIQNEDWCKGILWWKFPSYLEYRGRENDAFTPNNKLTEETVKKWFLQ